MKTSIKPMDPNFLRLKDKANVIGVGYGKKRTGGVKTHEDALIVFVLGPKIPLKNLEEKDIIPTSLDGLKTDVYPLKEEIKILTLCRNGVLLPCAAEGRTTKFRPAPVGVSAGNSVNVTAGSTSNMFEINSGVVDDGVYVNSAAHVYVSYPTQDMRNQNKVIVQQGIYDDGTVDASSWADLAWAMEIMPVGTGRNYSGIDNALGKPLNLGDASPSVLGLGDPNGNLKEFVEGLIFDVSGRTSGVYHGEVISTSTTSQVVYDGNTCIMEDVVISSFCLQGGDSGSSAWVKEKDGSLSWLGTGFAGSSQVSVFTKGINLIHALGGLSTVRVLTVERWKQLTGDSGGSGDEGNGGGDGDGDGGSGEGGGDVSPPAPPAEWTLPAIGTFLIAFGAYLVSLNNSQTLVPGIGLIGLGLLVLLAATKYTTIKKSKKLGQNSR